MPDKVVTEKSELVEVTVKKSIPSKYSTPPPGNAPFLRANREKFLKENA